LNRNRHLASRSRCRQAHSGTSRRCHRNRIKGNSTSGYNRALGEGISRDPITELGFRLLTQTTRKVQKHIVDYGFVENDPIRYWDYLGLDNPGCDLPPGIRNTAVYQSNPDCFRRCCAQHDQCFYNSDCTSSSWFVNAVQIASSRAGRYGKILSCGLMFHPCVRCNNSAMSCFAQCLINAGPTEGPQWFCPNGPRAGEFFDNWDEIPPSCWENNVKPDAP
jgi:hypothetical protein